MILSVEPMESLRYLPFLADDGWLITNSKPFRNIDNYPDEDALYKEIRKLTHSLLIDADKIAADTGSRKVSNIVMLGAASAHIGVEYMALEHSIKKIFGRKGEEIVQMNLAALTAGKSAAHS